MRYHFLPQVQVFNQVAEALLVLVTKHVQLFAVCLANLGQVFLLQSTAQ